MKKTLSIILALLMLISVFPLSAFAAEADVADIAAEEDVAAVSADEDLADTGAEEDVAPVAADVDLSDTGAVINSVNANVSVPYAGNKASFSASTSGTTYTVGSVRWYYGDSTSDLATGSNEMTSSDVFRAGKYYRVWIMVTPNSGYTLAASSNSSSSVSATVNGVSATATTVPNYTADQKIWIRKDFGPVTDTGLKSIAVTVTFPMPGTSPSYVASTSTTGVQIEDYDSSNAWKDGVYWYDVTASSMVSPSDTSYKFIEGHKYTVKVNVSPRAGYSFFRTTSSITGTVNGLTGTVENFSTNTADRDLKVCYTYTSAYNTTGTITLSGVTSPSVGSSPTFSASESSSAYDVYSSYGNTSFKNGVRWVDVTSSTNLATDGSAKFAAGHQYRVEVFVKTTTNWRFGSGTVTGTINGNTGTVTVMESYSSSQYRVVSYTFSTLGYYSCSSAALTNVPTSITANTAPAYTAATVSSTGCVASSYTSGSVKNGVAWYDVTAGSYVSPSNTSYKFIAGHKYYARYFLVTKDNYKFSSSFTATVNGSSAGTATWSGLNSDYYMTVTSPTMTATATITNISITGVTVPEAGKTPTYSATFSSSSEYQSDGDNTTTGWSNGVHWYNVTDGKAMTSSDKFVGGKQYRVTVGVKPKTGYTLAATSQITARINGYVTTDMVTYTAGSDIGIRYTWTCDTPINKITLTGVTSPMPGVAPSFAAPTIASSESYYAYTGLNSNIWKNGIQWYDKTANSTVPTNDSSYKFISGHQYIYKAIVTTKANSYFASASVPATVNGNTASTNGISDYSVKYYLAVNYTFTCPTAISTVGVSDIDPPVAGRTPDYTATISSSWYESDGDSTTTNWKNGILWYNVTDSKSMASSDTFVAGKKYRVLVGLNAKSGYAFMPTASLTGTVNGNATTDFIEYYAGRHIGIRYTFTAQSVTEISSVEVTGVTAPLPGAKPVYSATAPSGKGYKVETTWGSSGTTTQNGIQWYKVSGSTETLMEPTETFVNGSQYKVKVSLVTTAATYQFASDVAGTLNTHTAVINKWSDGKSNIGVNYTFTCKNKTTVSSVEAFVNPPRPGEHPSYYATTPNGFGYSIITEKNNNMYKNGVQWDHGSSYFDTSTTYTYINGDKYTVIILLKPSDEYYQFASTVTGKVNGQTASVFVSGDNSGNRYMEYTFTCGYATKIDTLEANVVAPLPGKSPNYSATLAENQGYKLMPFTSGYWSNGIEWLQGSTPLSSSASFEKGKTYTVKMVLVPISNVFEFKSSGVTGTVNGNSATVSYSPTNQQIYLSYTFTCKDPTVINSVAIKNIAEPFGGDVPSYYSYTDTTGARIETEWNNDNYVKNGMYWNDASGNRMKYTDKFETGKKYTVRISLKHKDYYKFADTITATVNGKTATNVGNYMAGENPWVEYTFTAQKPITTVSSVKVTGIVPPKAGFTASYNRSIEAGKGYQVEALTGDNYKDGVCWRDESGNALLNDGSWTFELGKKYMVDVSLLLTDTSSYKFAAVDSMTGTVNGHSTSNFHAWNSTNYSVRYTFTCKEATEISDVAVTVTAPVAGAAPSYTATVPSGKGYRVETEWSNISTKNGVTWWDQYNNPVSVSDTSFKFTAGCYYKCRVSLYTNDDSTYAFAATDKIRGTMNDFDATVGSWGGDQRNNYAVTYTFKCYDTTPVAVSIDVTSYLANEDLTVTLTGVSNGKSYEKTVVGTKNTSVNVAFASVYPGDYKVSISKKNHATRELKAAIGFEPYNLTTKILPKGDISGDGKVNSKDSSMAFQAAQGKLALTPYQIACGDVVKNDKKVTSNDASRIFQHAQNKSSLWT